jgi:hypothetical protein
MPMETFHRHLWQGMWENKNVYETSHRQLWEGMRENKNVYGNVCENFPQTFLFSYISS